jgi:hypothetical protein
MLSGLSLQAPLDAAEQHASHCTFPEQGHVYVRQAARQRTTRSHHAGWTRLSQSKSLCVRLRTLLARMQQVLACDQPPSRCRKDRVAVPYKKQIFFARTVLTRCVAPAMHSLEAPLEHAAVSCLMSAQRQSAYPHSLRKHNAHSPQNAQEAVHSTERSGPKVHVIMQRTQAVAAMQAARQKAPCQRHTAVIVGRTRTSLKACRLLSHTSQGREKLCIHTDMRTYVMSRALQDLPQRAMHGWRHTLPTPSPQGPKSTRAAKLPKRPRWTSA